MKALRFLLMGAFALALLACSEKENEELDDEGTGSGYNESYYAEHASISSDDSAFTASSAGGTIAFKSTGGQVVVRVDCGTDWTASEGADWLETDVNISAGTLIVSASQNTVEEERESYLTLATAASGIEFAAIGVVQNAYGSPEVSLTVNEWHAPAVGELTTEIGVTSSAAWTAESQDAWLTVTQNGDSVTIEALENGEYEEREGSVVVRCSDGVGFDTETVTVIQDALAYVVLSDDSLVFEHDRSTANVAVDSNFDWEFSYDSSNGWFEVALNGDGLMVTASTNDSDNARAGEVTVTAGDGKENVATAVLTIVQEATQANLFILTYQTVSANTEITLPFTGLDADTGQPTVNCTIDWGDGTVEEVNKIFPSHTYSQTGEYDVKIDGYVSGLNSYGVGSSNRLIAIKQWGHTGLASMYCAFYGCSNLASIAADDDESLVAVYDLTDAFYGCSSLKELPAGLFANCTRNFSLYCCFYNCTSLSVIPSDIFSGCRGVTNANWLFSGCSSLTSIPEGLFDPLESVVQLNHVFYNCQALTSVPAGLFDKCKAVDFSYAFAECRKLPAIPSGLFAGQSSATSFDNVFFNCYALMALPDNLFEGCSAATNFDSAFFNCQALTSISDGLFEDCVNAESFYYTFDMCTMLASLPSGLFANCSKATDFTSTFAICVSLQTIPGDLFKNCSSATTFFETFTNCESLTEVPEGLFDGCTAATNFGGVFQSCTALKTIPSGLFDKCVNVTSFGQVFYGCNALTALHSKMFANCPKVTSFADAFGYCRALKELPEDLFEGQENAVNFTRAFEYCTGLTSLPDKLFEPCTNATTFTEVFSRCQALMSIPANLFAANKKVTSFNSAFYNDPALTGESAYDVIDGVHVHLYERMDDAYKGNYNVSSLDVSHCYAYCTGLDDYDTMPSDCTAH